MRPGGVPASLRWRLLAATLTALAAALLLAGWTLTALFREHAMAQFEATLGLQLDQVTARLDFTPDGRPALDPQGLADPRFARPYSGLYWQVDGAGQRGVLRSRSLWDLALVLPPDILDDGAVHTHPGTGPQGAAVLMLERSVRDAQPAAPAWRVVVAGATASLDQAVDAFRGQLVLSLAVLFLLLAAAAWAQVAVGLAPLSALRRSLERVRTGAAARLDGRFPREVQPLVDEFNAVLGENAAVVERARHHAGNLAHAVKTPLAVLQQAGERLARMENDAAPLGRQVMEQVALAQRHVQWHLARARSAGAGTGGRRVTPIAPVVQGLLRTMERLHAERGLRFETALDPAPLAFAGEEQDLQEMVGNLLDNACQWAGSQVRVRAGRGDGLPAWLQIEIEDDGPGIAPDQLAALPQRGARLDESRPGTGLGLAIARDLAELYGGRLDLQAGGVGGLCARLTLPAATGWQTGPGR